MINTFFALLLYYKVFYNKYKYKYKYKYKI